MDKNAIKKYAVWARNELIERVSQKADQYEISADADPNADYAHGVLLTADEKKQRAALIGQVKEKGQDQVMEEVAYTWFNRFSALRFMEVNNYLPSRVRVFTDADGSFKPEILAEAIHLELDGLDMEKVYALKDANDDDALFKYLIITQCSALSGVLPGMFQKIADYTELLFPDNLLRKGSVIERMISDIPESDWNISEGGQVEIIGWLYQYYISEKMKK
ncbi:BREX-1 system adenine-specific DNA-methyltransferase PglX [Lactobacillus delbrueckii]|uniref:BREX-1 system adenine-specific DNA-methyltransferase PglX n=1 Tax=Lactobacillus delbrueckii TaxID=1584 RepID=UPI0021A2D393|nr:BREX-1 system adenine-specific DNA-methyltransferase PglX [Lactobacillus delbrueckii]